MALIRLCWVGETRDSAFRLAEDDYLARLGRLHPCRREVVREASKRDLRARTACLRKDAGGVLRRIGDKDWVMLLDPGGISLRTEELAELVGRRLQSGGCDLVLVGPGPWGVTDQIRHRADFLLSLSRLTFPHELARVIVLEQLYRALTILQGHPYHK
ncbi:MAG TPA: 23S rRNA (pseudouridine(1915)-N(3))-methyltransferase RlmH [Acidobacteriota bacterium]|nr:23S rRNA (pseudouridine(1915)-N(3))-methyltransferase RlmH [Acidobacteriota bacterium]HRV07951.1 23S rRNA (pseudouridine(1915)-N(3))-methyltransferase RlmH [Acidobacteriota bacterium]